MTFQGSCVSTSPVVAWTNVFVMSGGVTNSCTNAVVASGFINIFDPWGMPYNYYCSPTTAHFRFPNTVGWAEDGYHSGWNRNGIAVGGQVNIKSFDLFSYGPDQVTFVSSSAIPAASSHGDTPWNLNGADICLWECPVPPMTTLTNWQR